MINIYIIIDNKSYDDKIWWYFLPDERSFDIDDFSLEGDSKVFDYYHGQQINDTRIRLGGDSRNNKVFERFIYTRKTKSKDSQYRIFTYRY